MQTFQMKMRLICMKLNLNAEQIFTNSEMACSDTDANPVTVAETKPVSRSGIRQVPCRSARFVSAV